MRFRQKCFHKIALHPLEYITMDKIRAISLQAVDHEIEKLLEFFGASKRKALEFF
jgi:hypothetical protein